METARVLYPGLFQAEKRGNESMQEESPTQTSYKMQMWPVERFMLIHEAREVYYSFIAR
jgi:hypothetical protein